MYALRARYVLPVESQPLRDGAVVVDGQRIVAVGPASAHTEAEDLGHVVLLPGLVNTHTHLEFSGLTEPLGWPGMLFTEWIAHVVAWRRERDISLEQARQWRAAAIRRGLVESLRCGVTALGDVATSPWSSEPCLESPAEVLAFLELIGLSEPRAAELEEMARQHLEAARGDGPSLVRGISPHAPYTVRWEAFVRLCRLSATARVPLAVHLAETREELELLRSAGGALVELLVTLNAWDPTALPRGLRPLDCLQALSAAHRVLVIHGNYLDSDDLGFLSTRRDRMTVVYCPRTHDYFGRGPYRLAQMLAAGVSVALGTDSRASNPDLSLLDEMRRVATDHPDVPPETILRLGTLAGAEALGLAERLGSLRPGKQADLAVVRLPDDSGDDPYAFLGDATCGVARVYKSGRQVCTAQGQPT